VVGLVVAAASVAAGNDGCGAAPREECLELARMFAVRTGLVAGLLKMVAHDEARRVEPASTWD
jgi:hypothetical protein